MSESLLSPKRRCYVCGSEIVLHKHHVFYGVANRKRSEQYGCWIWLCPEHHNMSDKGIHFNTKLDRRVKRECQQAWEMKYGTREEFIAVFGKSWL